MVHGLMSSPSASPAPPGLLQLITHRDYVLFWLSRLFGSLAATAQAVIIAWEVYETARRTSSVPEAAFAVGMIGLAQFLPLFALTLPAGEIADRLDRRRILLVCLAIEVVVVAVLAVRVEAGWHSLWPVFGCAVVFGGVRAFYYPAAGALAPMLVPTELLPRAIAANSLAWQASGIAGPALGGLLCAISPAVGYGVCLALYLAAGLCAWMIRQNTKPQITPGRSRVELIKEGLQYIWTNKIVLGSISLDLFAVLLGGATALLPVFAKDVLHVGPVGFGVLRAAPAIGALVVAAYLAVRPIRTQVGLKMFAAVACYGVATAAFGLSQIFIVSLGLLIILGAADMVSVFARQSLVQITTPDAMRGRVSAVSSLFVGASNELGEFETGVMARLIGPVGAVVAGGAASLAVTALWAKLFPALRKADRLV
jgi:MFS family permease